MPNITEQAALRLDQRRLGLRDDRLPFWNLWRDLAGYYIPHRYVALESAKERRIRDMRNPMILDSTGTAAGKVLSSGMMNGITSPARIWFKLRFIGFPENERHDVRLWLEEVERRMRLVMATSNFYNALAVMYVDLVFFGTAAVLIYQDSDDVIRCYNPALGEYYLGQDYRLKVNTFCREFRYKAHQIMEQWPDREYWPEVIKTAEQQKGTALMVEHTIYHMIEPNVGDNYGVPKSMPFREVYWMQGQKKTHVLAVNGYHELPGIFPRWGITANDTYGYCPGMEALGDTIQLQHETKRKAQGLDKIVAPPMIADVELANKPVALLPNGITFVSRNSEIGMKPAYQVNLGLQELTADIREVQARIRETFHNDLFQMISQLDTVRSATEIDARREEKLVLLGPVLERFENEALDPAINRIYNIMDRMGLIPEPPSDLNGQEIEIQYVSILSSAQSAVGVASVERWLQLIGNLAGINPSILNIPDFDAIIRNYARDVGVPASNVRSRAESDRLTALQARQAAEQRMLEQLNAGADTARLLSETDVGGGANALQVALGG